MKSSAKNPYGKEFLRSMLKYWSFLCLFFYFLFDRIKNRKRILNNFLLKFRHEKPYVRRIAIFHIQWPLQIHTKYFAESFARSGWQVDLFVTSDSLLRNIVSLKGIKSNKRIKFFEICSGFNVKKLITETRQLLSKDYTYLVGIEKKGLVLAGFFAEEMNIPLIYYNLELYIEDHPNIRKGKMKELRIVERFYHAKAWKTIIQDILRANVLFRSNKIKFSEDKVLLLPVSVKGGKNFNKNFYFHNKFGLDRRINVLLYFGMISTNRFCLELAKYSNLLPSDMVLIFHGYYMSEQEKNKVESLTGYKFFVSSEIVDDSKIPELISSATIGLVLYRNDFSNDRLTAFASEKLAYFAQSGIPVLTFQNESYSLLYSYAKFGEEINGIDEIDIKISLIMENYDNYRNAAYMAYEKFYDYEVSYERMQSVLNSEPTSKGHECQEH